MAPAAALAALKRLFANSSLRRSEEGQDLLEYGLLAALIAVVAFGAVAAVGDAINTVFWTTIAGNF